jgi:hypothetical protein
MSQPEPTALDHENAARHREIADRQAAEYSDAVWLAIDALWAGYRPWMKLVLIDADHRKTGNVEPVATVYKVFTGDAWRRSGLLLRRLIEWGSADGEEQHTTHQGGRSAPDCEDSIRGGHDSALPA